MHLSKEKTSQQPGIKDRFLYIIMDRKHIAKLAGKMKTKEDLLSLLNRIKMSWLEDLGMQDQFRPFTMRQLNYYSNPNNTFHRYRQFKIKKKSGGFRQITAPRNKTYRLMLFCLNEMFKSIYTPSDYAMGFTEKRSVVTNATIHKGQNYVFNIDLKDFFPSIYRVRVRARLQIEPFKFNEPIAILVAGLCSMKVADDHTDGSNYVLPQGAPTSPIITNMICDKLDRLLARLAKHFGLKYSRYADDITFSSMHYVYKEGGEFRTELERIIADQGFRINDAKTRLQKKGSRQEVTGIIVSDKLNVTQKYVRDIRNILYIWDRYGYTAASSRFIPKYKSEKGHVKKGNPELLNVMEGKLLYLKMVKGDEDSVYKRLHDKFQRLADQVRDPNKTTKQKVTYIDTWTLRDFEKKYNTEIVFVQSSTEEDLNCDSTVEVPHRYARFVFGEKTAVASINRIINDDDLANKAMLSISHCQDATGKTFWLIHRSDRINVQPPSPVDVDELNNELDSLLNM